VPFVTTQPEALMASAGNLQGIGSAMSAAYGAAAAPRTEVVPAAADEVSALTAKQFPRTRRSIRPSVRRPRRSTRCS
jgi:PE family